MSILSDSFRSWMAQFIGKDLVLDPEAESNIWGQEIDREGDLWNNILEYTFNGNPNLRELKNSWINTSIFKSSSSDEAFLEVCLNCRVDDPLLTISLELSSNRIDWIPVQLVLENDTLTRLSYPDRAEIIEVSPTAHSGFSKIVLRDKVPVKPGAPRYARIHVTR